MNRFTVVSLFPQFVEAFSSVGVIGRACADALIEIAAINPRDFARDRRGTVDDTPYGGGPGMVMMVAPLRLAIDAARARCTATAHVAYLTPQGRRFDQHAVAELRAFEHLILVAGRYEGIDERLIEHDIDSEWSVGDFVVSGGELPAMLMIDAVTRTIPGTLGDERSALEDSFSDDLLDHPHYTRPETVDGIQVPAVLTSGDHAAIARWRRQQRLVRTLQRRPDLLKRGDLSGEDEALVAEYLDDAGAVSAALRPGTGPE